MKELVNPKDLKSLADLAKKFGLDGEHLRQVAVSGRIRAWHVGHVWISTEENVAAYLASRKPAGRRPAPGSPAKRKGV